MMSNYSHLEEGFWRKETEISPDLQQSLLEIYNTKTATHPPFKDYTLNRAEIEWLISHFSLGNYSGQKTRGRP